MGLTDTKTRIKIRSRPWREGFFAIGRGKDRNPYYSIPDKFDEWQAGWEARYYHEVAVEDVKPLPPRR